VGSLESLFASHLHAAVSQSARADQRQEQEAQKDNGQSKEGRLEKNQQAAAKKRQAKRAAEKTRQGSKTPHKTRPELMAEMIAMVAAWFPDRQFLLVVDSL
jgi:hypothetical protein